ncbi:MAG: 4-alpha-glucanotransferase [Candidatus Methylomirabilales bacterium]
MHDRTAGILLHLTSLPSAYGIGDLGPAAHAFVDFLAAAGQRYWQILPVNPTSPARGNSPYSSLSALAGNALLVSPEFLVRDGLLPASALEPPPRFPADRADCAGASAYKAKLFEAAYGTLAASRAERAAFEAFCRSHAGWLDDYCLFVVIKRQHAGRSWSDWPVELRDRRASALRAVAAHSGEELEREKFSQYLFARQWQALRDHCRARGVRVIGDLPIYVDFDSADVWAHPELFRLGPDRRPEVVSGVPPDYFSATGQLWGNPIYRWDRLRATGFQWWVERIQRNAELFDALRIDHFRGLVAHWEVPASEATAVHGRWVEVPTDELFAALRGRVPDFPFIAEDLGLITPDVQAARDRLGLPGMKVLLFAFMDRSACSPYLPHMYPRNCVVYTGTHDNNTARGWFERELSPEQRRYLGRYLGCEVTAEQVSWALVRLAMLSVADTAILPMQDVLGLDERARMNRPGVGDGNWEWRLSPAELTPDLAARLRELTEISGRI